LVEGPDSDRVLAVLGLSLGEVDRCEGVLVVPRAGRRPMTLAEVWLGRRAGREVSVPPAHGLLLRCLYALLGREAGILELVVVPLALPPEASAMTVRVAGAFAEWEAARSSCEVLPDPGRVVLSVRLWADLAGVDAASVRRARDWLLKRGSLVEAEPEPSRWEGRPTGAYRRGPVS
jgi:hypothetical protein